MMGLCNARLSIRDISHFNVILVRNAWVIMWVLSVLGCVRVLEGFPRAFSRGF